MSEEEEAQAATVEPSSPSPSPTTLAAKIVTEEKAFDWSKVPAKWITKYGKTNLALYQHYMEKLECQDYFVTWNYNYAISSCLGRKVWLGQEGDFPIFANLFLFFVGPPGASKSLPAVKTAQILDELKDLIIKDGKGYERKLVCVAPDSVTIESLYDKMAEASEGLKVPGKPGALYVHSSVSFCLAEEVGVLFREKTNDLIMFLTAGWNCGNFRRGTKTQGSVDIRNMCINFLGCCTPKWYRDMMSNKLINEGFTGRVLHIYGSKKRHYSKNLNVTPEQQASLAQVKKHLKMVCKAFGELKFTKEAEDYIDHWSINIYPTERLNKDAKLEFYYERKRHHLKKLSIIAHYHNKTNAEIDIEDVQLAEKMSKEIEPTMHLALQSEVTNNVAILADAILGNINNNGQLTKLEIVKQHFNQGSMEELDQAIDKLKQTGEIHACQVRGQTGYSIMEEDEEEEEEAVPVVIPLVKDKLAEKEEEEEEKLKQMIIGKQI